MPHRHTQTLFSTDGHDQKRERKITNYYLFFVTPTRGLSRDPVLQVFFKHVSCLILTNLKCNISFDKLGGQRGQLKLFPNIN